MLIYEHFIFIHMPKTAGTFIAEALRNDLSQPVETLETHSGWEAVPADAAGRPVLMYVRNPWDWYVSWYHFWTQSWLPRQWQVGTRPPPLARLLLGEDVEITERGLRGVYDFATVVRRACESLGFYTARFKHLAGAGLTSDLLTIGRYESLLDDLEQFFTQHGIPLDDDVLPRIRARAPVNAIPHRPYREYYDDELRDLVGQSCRELIETFDYSF